MELLENMPINQTRWESAHSSILSTYRTTPLPYRGTAGYIYDIQALGHKEDLEKIALKEQVKRPKSFGRLLQKLDTAKN